METLSEKSQDEGETPAKFFFKAYQVGTATLPSFITRKPLA